MDKNKNNVDDRAEIITSVIHALAPVVLIVISLGCIVALVQLPELTDTAKNAIADTRTVSFSSGLALLGIGRKREKNGNG